MDGFKPFHTLNQVKLHLKLVGCSPIQSNRFYRFFCIPIYIAVIFIVLISYSLSSLSFLFFNVKTFIDFTESAFWASRSVLSLAVYTTFVWHRKDLTKILDNLDEIICKRQYLFQSDLNQVTFEKSTDIAGKMQLKNVDFWGMEPKNLQFKTELKIRIFADYQFSTKVRLISSYGS